MAGCYLPLEGKGYRHEVAFLKGNSRTAAELLPRVHRVAALLKRRRMGTHRGALSLESAIPQASFSSRQSIRFHSCFSL